MTLDTTDMRLQDIEWEAWQAVCAELLKLGIDINNQDALNDYLVNWGNRLVELRSYQASLPAKVAPPAQTTQPQDIASEEKAMG
jgi:hypothetical protein